jgi:hypothetical protein
MVRQCRTDRRKYPVHSFRRQLGEIMWISQPLETSSLEPVLG